MVRAIHISTQFNSGKNILNQTTRMIIDKVCLCCRTCLLKGKNHPTQNARYVISNCRMVRPSSNTSNFMKSRLRAKVLIAHTAKFHTVSVTYCCRIFSNNILLPKILKKINENLTSAPLRGKSMNKVKSLYYLISLGLHPTTQRRWIKL